MIDVNASFVVIDIETTGLFFEYWDEPIEVCAIRIENGRIGETFHKYIKPYKTIPKKVTELTRISNETVKDCENKYKILPLLRSFIGDSIVVAQSAKFDVNFLNFWFLQLKLPLISQYICTMNTYRNIIKRKGGKGRVKAKLIDLCNYFGVTLKEAHSAYYDTMATANVFIKELDFISDIDFTDGTDDEAYISVKKRIAKSGYYSKIVDVISLKEPYKPKEICLTDELKSKCFKMLDTFKKSDYILKNLDIDMNTFEELFIRWMNNLNINKHYHLINNTNATKSIKETLKYSKGDLDRALKLHKEIFSTEPNTFMYKIIHKLEYGSSTMDYRVEDFLYYFDNIQPINEIAKKAKRDKLFIVPFFTKWLLLDENNKELYRDYIKDHIIGAKGLKMLLEQKDINSFINALDKENKFKSILTYELYKNGFFKIKKDNIA